MHPPEWKNQNRTVQNPTSRFGVSSVLTPTPKGTHIGHPDASFSRWQFSSSYHIQDVLPYADLSKQRCQSCIACGKSIDERKQEKINWYMEKSTPRSETAYITSLRREAYSNGLNADSLLFLAPAVLQAFACDGTRITKTAYGQATTSGTLPIY